MANNFDYKKEFNKYKKKAQLYLKDNDKLDQLILDTEAKLKTIPKLGDTLSYVPVFLDMLRCYITGEYKEIPTGTLISICAVLLYFISPIDLIPDAIPVLGLADDAAIVLAGLVLVKSDLDIFINWRKKKPVDVLVKPKKAVKKAAREIDKKVLTTKAKVVKAKVKHEVKKDVKKAEKKVKKAGNKIKKAVNK